MVTYLQILSGPSHSVDSLHIIHGSTKLDSGRCQNIVIIKLSLGSSSSTGISKLKAVSTRTLPSTQLPKLIGATDTRLDLSAIILALLLSALADVKMSTFKGLKVRKSHRPRHLNVTLKMMSPSRWGYLLLVHEVLGLPLSKLLNSN